MSTESRTELTPRHDEVDGVLMLRAALRHGLDVELYPRQVFTAICQGTELSFVHGLPGTSGLAPVTYAQDKRMRRALMERAEVPVPRGATFTMGRGIPGARRFAADVGFPVVVKPAVGDNAIETFRGVYDAEGMDLALDYLSTPPAERAGFSRAAYGLTELREPGEVDGRRVVPPGYQFMVEKQLDGEQLRVLIIDGQVRSVLRCEGAPSDSSLSGGEEILDRVHQGLVALAERAAAVIPGLAVVALDIVVPDPFAAPEGQTVGVVEYSERPGLWVQATADRDLARQLAEEILRSYAADLSVTLPEAREEVSVGFEAHAVPDVAEGAAAIERAAAAAGLRVEITGTDRLAGIVTADLSGDADAVAHLANALLDGVIEGQRVMLGVLTHRA